jgi:hypothetical protein
MSTVLLATLNPTASTTWSIPLTYYGFKHISLRGAIRIEGTSGAAQTAYWTVSSNGGTSGLSMIGHSLVRQNNSNTRVAITSQDVIFGVDNLAVSDNYTSVEIFISDYATTDSQSNVEMKSIGSYVGAVLRMEHMTSRTLLSSQVNHITLTAPTNWNTSSILRVFGHRG